MLSGFTDLVQQTDRQRDLAITLAQGEDSTRASSAKFHVCAHETSKALECFVQRTLNGAHAGIAMVEGIENIDRRMGEIGRGFAVVADEVRELSE